MRKYPLRFRPILKERVWGGQALATLFARALPPGVKIGESWEVVDRPPDTSVVENGPLSGRTLHELCRDHGRDLLGVNAPRSDSFPLIAKLLDPNDRLSVQVHPSVPYVARHPEAEGIKNEAWYALDARPGAAIIHGLKEGIGIEQLGRALETGQVEPLLRSVPVEAGRFYYIPSGLVHALLPGAVMVEIQQNCDATFRLYDWGRLGLDGRPRPLHVAEAIESAETFLGNPALAQHENLGLGALPGGIERVAGLVCPSFQIEALRLPPGRTRLGLDTRSFTLLMAVHGSLAARCADGEEITVELGAGDSALVPAAVEALSLDAPQGARLLKTTLPDLAGTTG